MENNNNKSNIPNTLEQENKEREEVTNLGLPVDQKSDFSKSTIGPKKTSKNLASYYQAPTVQPVTQKEEQNVPHRLSHKEEQQIFGEQIGNKLDIGGVEALQRENASKLREAKKIAKDTNPNLTKEQRDENENNVALLERWSKYFDDPQVKKALTNKSIKSANIEAENIIARKNAEADEAIAKLEKEKAQKESDDKFSNDVERMNELYSKTGKSKAEKEELRDLQDYFKFKKDLGDDVLYDDAQSQYRSFKEYNEAKKDLSIPENVQKVQKYEHEQALNKVMKEQNVGPEEAEGILQAQEQQIMNDKAYQQLRGSLEEALKDPYTKDWAQNELKMLDYRDSLSKQFPNIIKPQDAAGMLKQDMANFAKIEQLKKQGKEKELQLIKKKNEIRMNTLKQMALLGVGLVARLLTLYYIKGLTKL